MLQHKTQSGPSLAVSGDCGPDDGGVGCGEFIVANFFWLCTNRNFDDDTWSYHETLH